MADTASVRNSAGQEKPKNRITGKKQKENFGAKNNQQQVKKIKGARPDMTKAKGARPSYIQRQAGSGIPKGIGKPGGAAGIKPGKR